MKRCRTCCLPDTKPDIYFDDTGQCSACINVNKKQKEIDWDDRKVQLSKLLDRHHGEVMVPSSGGKDSHAIALTLKEMGANVTAVTARTCYITDIGRQNLDNLARHVRTIEVVPNMTIRAKLNRLGLEYAGDIELPEHFAIFGTPFRVAVDTGHKLLMYGENSQAEYGGPMGTEDARQLTQRWRDELGGLCGMRPSDFIGVEGITARDMEDYEFPLGGDDIEAHFLGAYIPWDSHANANLAMKNGMIQKKPCTANWWKAENLDSAVIGIHDHLMYRKFAFGRGCSQISVDVRHGAVEREEALRWVHQFDGMFPHEYAGVPAEEVVDHIGMEWGRFMDTINSYTNWSLFDGQEDLRPILKC